VSLKKAVTLGRGGPKAQAFWHFPKVPYSKSAPNDTCRVDGKNFTRFGVIQ